jgi:hypothetical protein
VVEGGDHSFNVPKKLQVTEEEIYDRILERTLAWLKQTL